MRMPRLSYFALFALLALLVIPKGVTSETTSDTTSDITTDTTDQKESHTEESSVTTTTDEAPSTTASSSVPTTTSTFTLSLTTISSATGTSEETLPSEEETEVVTVQLLLDIPLSSFNQANFINQLATLLGIPASDIVIVSVEQTPNGLLITFTASVQADNSLDVCGVLSTAFSGSSCQIVSGVSTTTTSAAKQESSEGGLGSGAVAGIVIGVFVGVVLIIVLLGIFLLLRRKKTKQVSPTA